MKFQIIVPPSLTKGEMRGYPPYGAMYIGRALVDEGHVVRIENGDTDNFNDKELLRRIKKFSPDAVGFSATVSTSYKYVKGMSALVRREFPSIKIVVGGGLSAAAEVVLKNTETDIVVISEGDITVKELAQCISQGQTYNDVAGLAFKEDHIIERTPARRPIGNMDILKYPTFDLVDMERYLIDIRSYVKGFASYKNPDSRLFASNRSKKMLRIPISRGCISRCSFCYRSVLGLRHFSFPYIFDYLEYLMKKNNINIFSFGDECFAPNKAWMWKFLEEFKKRNLDIMFQIFGAKVETVDRDILKALKDAGCFAIEYGFESGSQKMLNVMEKRVIVAQNIAVAKWTKESAIFTMPAVVLGMPGETAKTINETIEFLKEIDYGPKWYQYTYAFAVPGTPLYEYAKVTGLIKDEDKYLESIYSFTPNDFTDSRDFINFTTEPLDKVKNWQFLIQESLFRHYSKGRLDYIIKRFINLEGFIFYFKKYGAIKTIIRIVDSLFGIFSNFIRKQPKQDFDNANRGEYLNRVGMLLNDDQQGVSIRRLLNERLLCG